MSDPQATIEEHPLDRACDLATQLWAEMVNDRGPDLAKDWIIRLATALHRVTAE